LIPWQRLYTLSLMDSFYFCYRKGRPEPSVRLRSQFALLFRGLSLDHHHLLFSSQWLFHLSTLPRLTRGCSLSFLWLSFQADLLPLMNSKVKAAQAAWNSKLPSRIALAYTPDSVWRNRDQFVRGREDIISFLEKKWEREKNYTLRKEVSRRLDLSDRRR